MANYDRRTMREYVARRRGGTSWKSLVEDASVLVAVAAGEMAEGCAAKVLGLGCIVDVRERVNRLLDEAKKREDAFFAEKGDSGETSRAIESLASNLEALAVDTDSAEVAAIVWEFHNLLAINANLLFEVRRLRAEDASRQGTNSEGDSR